AALGRDETRGRRSHGDVPANRLEMPHVGHADVLDAALAEPIAMYADDCVVHVHVLVDGDVPDVHVGVPLDDDVVHDVWPAPATPPRVADEADGTPPRDARLSPSERDPTEERGTDAHGD